MTTNKNNKDWTGGKSSIFTCLAASNHTLEEREVNDYYATDPEAAEWLLELEPELDNIWECACGEGHLAKVFDKAGKLLWATDLINRGYGGIMDFLNINTNIKHNGDIVSNPPYSCYDSNTEVLTQGGWKYFCNVKPEDKILSVNIDTLELEWSDIITQYEYEVDDELVHFGGFMDLLVTKNHRMFAFRRQNGCSNIVTNLRTKSGDVYTADMIRPSHLLPKLGYNWSGKNQEFLKLNATSKKNSRCSEVEIPELLIPMDIWVEFFGFWLADGSCRHTLNSQGNSRYVVSIKQHDSNADYVKQLLDKMPFDYRVYKNKGRNSSNYEINNKQLWEYLIKFGKSAEKYIPNEIKDLPSSKLQKFMRGYMSGDSTVTQGGKTQGYILSSVSKRLIDDLAEIVLKLGYLVTHIRSGMTSVRPYYSFSFYDGYKKTQNYLTYSQKTLVPYKGKVYCVTLEKNGFMLVRRNNYITISGNSAERFIRKALDTVTDGRKVCMFLKLTFLESKSRKQLFEQYPPKTIWVSSSRISCAKNGDFDKYPSSAVAYAWYIWEKGYTGETVVKWFN